MSDLIPRPSRRDTVLELGVALIGAIPMGLLVVALVVIR